MKINRNIIYTLVLFLSFAFIACDNIDENERLKVDNKIPEKPEVRKKVLLEEFTGTYCANCPAASAIAHEIQKRLGDQLIIVNLHAGRYASNTKLLSEASVAYLEFFYPGASNPFPAAMFSRTQTDGSYANTNPHNWETIITNRLNSDFLKGREFSFSIQPEYSPENNSITVRTNITAVDELSGLKLQLWVTESKIIGLQLGVGTNYPNYEHNHILRDAINGIWGEDIEKVHEGLSVEMISNEYSLNEKPWEVKNLDIVGFIYDGNTKEVLDVIEVKLIGE